MPVDNILVVDILEESTPFEVLTINDDIAEMTEALNKIPSEDREILTLRFYCDMKNTEIAKIYGISENNVAVKISRAKEKLRVEILRRRQTHE